MGEGRERGTRVRAQMNHPPYAGLLCALTRDILSRRFAPTSRARGEVLVAGAICYCSPPGATALRLFVAVPLPEMIRTRLQLLCGGLPGVRWVPPENFHITLRFIGEVDGGTCHDIDASLAGIRAPRFSLTLAGVGHFGNGRSVRAIWAGVEKEPGLHHLHDKVESAIVRAGQPAEGKKFTPHITLARPKVPPPVNKLQSFLAANNLFRTPAFEVTQFTLFSSFLGSESANYRPESEYELAYA